MSDTPAVDDYDLAEAIVRKQLEIKRLTEEVDVLKGWFRQGKTVELEREGRPTFVVKVTPNSRIDDKLARERLGAPEYEAVSKTVIDTTKARAHLTADELALITKHYEPKVEVQLA